MIRISFSYCSSIFSRHSITFRSNDFKFKTFGMNSVKNIIRETHNQNWNSHIQITKTVRNYAVSVAILTLGLTYAAVPLYRIFCQSTGYGGTAQHDIGGDKIEKMKKNDKRRIRVKFNSDVTNMQWQFKPQQNEIVVMPGETALAFYTATNPTNEPIIGVSTYNILPYNAAPYFNKIQCFCFEEQLLNPKEQVDMPVFFYIDPEYCEDPQLENINEVILSYTFFEAKKGTPLQLPGFSKK